MSTNFFGESLDVEELTRSFHNALTSNPPNEDEIVRILKKTDSAERLQIRILYKKLYNCPVQKDISDELSYKLKEVCLALMDTIYEFDARELHRAFHTFINDNKIITEIFSSRSKEHLNFVDSAYYNFYGISLKDDVTKETSVTYGKLLNALISTRRPKECTINEEEARNIASEIKVKGLKAYELDIELFKNTFIKKSREDLALIAQAYYEYNKETLYDAMKNELKTPARRLFKAVLFANINSAEYFSKKIFKALQGLGTDIRTLCRALVFEEHEMDLVREYYLKFRNSPLYDDVKEDCGGAYGDVLRNLCLK